MSFWKIIRSLKYTQLKSAALLFLKEPLFIFPTLKATRNSYNVAVKEYPKTHSLNGKANAFRHALWNMLICYECVKWTQNKSKAIAWAKTITDWHEEFSPNKLLTKAMDLQNNAIGRKLFNQIHIKGTKSITIDYVIKTLKNKISTSKKIESISNIDDYTEELVYIENDMILHDGFIIDKISVVDAVSIHKLMTSNAERFQRFFPKTLEKNLTIKLSHEFAAKKVQEFTAKEELLYTIKKSKTNQVVGLVYIKELDWLKKQGEFAYCLDIKYESKGLISKAVKELSIHAFNNLALEILQIIVHKSNIGSVRGKKHY